MMKRKYLITASVLLIVMGVGLHVYNLVNKPNESLTTAHSDLSVSSEKIISDFTLDEHSASTRYINKIIEVDGLLKSIETDHGPNTIVLGDSNSSTNLRFTVDSNFQINLASVEHGQRMILKGVCTGYNADELGLGADILFNRAIILNQTKK